MITDFKETKLYRLKTKEMVFKIAKILERELSEVKEANVFKHYEINGRFKIELIVADCLSEQGHRSRGLNVQVSSLKAQIYAGAHPSDIWEEIKPKD